MSFSKTGLIDLSIKLAKWLHGPQATPPWDEQHTVPKDTVPILLNNTDVTSLEYTSQFGVQGALRDKLYVIGFFDSVMPDGKKFMLNIGTKEVPKLVPCHRKDVIVPNPNLIRLVKFRGSASNEGKCTGINLTEKSFEVDTGEIREIVPLHLVNEIVLHQPLSATKFANPYDPTTREHNPKQFGDLGMELPEHTVPGVHSDEMPLHLTKFHVTHFPIDCDSLAEKAQPTAGLQEQDSTPMNEEPSAEKTKPVEEGHAPLDVQFPDPVPDGWRVESTMGVSYEYIDPSGENKGGNRDRAGLSKWRQDKEKVELRISDSRYSSYCRLWVWKTSTGQDLEDPPVPDGWKVKQKPRTDHVYVDPDGNKFNSRRAAGFDNVIQSVPGDVNRTNLNKFFTISSIDSKSQSNKRKKPEPSPEEQAQKEAEKGTKKLAEKEAKKAKRRADQQAVKDQKLAEKEAEEQTFHRLLQDYLPKVQQGQSKEGIAKVEPSKSTTATVGSMNEKLSRLANKALYVLLSTSPSTVHKVLTAEQLAFGGVKITYSSNGNTLDTQVNYCDLFNVWSRNKVLGKDKKTQAEAPAPTLASTPTSTPVATLVVTSTRTPDQVTDKENIGAIDAQIVNLESNSKETLRCQHAAQEIFFKCRNALQLEISGLQSALEEKEHEFTERDQKFKESMEADRVKIQTLQQRRARLLQQQEKERREREKREKEQREREKREAELAKFLQQQQADLANFKKQQATGKPEQQQAEHAKLAEQEAEHANLLQQPAAEKIKVEKNDDKPYQRGTKVRVATYVPNVTNKFQFVERPARVNTAQYETRLAHVAYTEENDFDKPHPSRELAWVSFDQLTVV